MAVSRTLHCFIYVVRAAQWTPSFDHLLIIASLYIVLDQHNHCRLQSRVDGWPRVNRKLLFGQSKSKSRRGLLRTTMINNLYLQSLVTTRRTKHHSAKSRRSCCCCVSTPANVRCGWSRLTSRLHRTGGNADESNSVDNSQELWPGSRWSVLSALILHIQLELRGEALDILTDRPPILNGNLFAALNWD